MQTKVNGLDFFSNHFFLVTQVDSFIIAATCLAYSVKSNGMAINFILYDSTKITKLPLTFNFKRFYN